MEKILPSERIQSELENLLNGHSRGEGDGQGLFSELIKKSIEKVLQEALEKEVTTFLGREYFERGERRQEGYRNGYEPKRFKTAEGRVEVSMPQLRNTEGPYRSRLLGELSGRSEELERLVKEMYVRGMSTRDVEDAFKDKEGNCLLSKSAVSDMTNAMNEDYEQFAKRDLSELDVVYLFADGVYESLRLNGGRKEGLLCAWGILSNGHKVMLHLALGNKESSENWTTFFRDMQRRGLRMPLLVVGDGAPGLIAAMEICFSLSKRQRCLFHKLSNIANKLPQDALDEVIPEIRACYYAANPDVAKLQAEAIVKKYVEKYPSAIKCFQEDLEACIVHLTFPKGHHKYIRTTNLLERCFEEQKRRTKIIPRFLSEQAGLKLVFATLIRVSEKWRKIKMSDYDLTLLKNMRCMFGEKAKSEDGFISVRLAA